MESEACHQADLVKVLPLTPLRERVRPEVHGIRINLPTRPSHDSDPSKLNQHALLCSAPNILYRGG